LNDVPIAPWSAVLYARQMHSEWQQAEAAKKQLEESIVGAAKVKDEL